MQKTILGFTLITCALLTMSSINVVNGQQSTDPRQNKKIIISKAGAEMKTPQAVVWRAYLGEVFTVQQTNGEWLWIKEKEGWLWEKEAVYYDTAIEDLSQRIKAMPTAENYHLRGVAFLAHENYDNAIADFSESLRKSPRNAGALNNRGQASYLKGDYKSAVTDFSGAVVMDPKNFLAYNNRALAYLETAVAVASLPFPCNVHP